MVFTNYSNLSFSINSYFLLSLYFYVMKPKLTQIVSNNQKILYLFLLNKWYIDELYEKVFVRPSKKIGSFFWKKGDIGIIDKFGPDGISNIVKKCSLYAVKFQSGFIYQYAFIMLLGFSLLLTFLIIK